LSHKSWSLKKVIFSILENANRPMLLHEIIWELNALFGFTFGKKTIAKIKHILNASKIFACNNEKEYLLNKNVEYPDVDIDSIQNKCCEILFNSNEIVGCDDLLERLESEGIEIKDLSPSMLSAILRNNNKIEEIGKNRFRIKQWKP